MGKEIKVSVVIPTYNSVKFVTEAIDSVLAQTFTDFEILVIDDGSKDETREVLAEKYGKLIRYLYKENGGVSTARNFGIENAKGKYIAFLDADDIWLPEKLEKQMRAFAENPKFKAGYTSLRKVTDDLKPIGIIENERTDSLIEDLLLKGNIVGSPSSVIYLRELFKISGGFDKTLSQCADWEMWIRLAIQTDFIFIKEPLVNYRIHASNMSKNASLLEKDSLLLMEKGFALPELPESLKKKRKKGFAKNYMVLAGTYFHVGQYKDFLRCLWKSAIWDFGQITYILKFPLRQLENSFNRAKIKT